VSVNSWVGERLCSDEMMGGDKSATAIHSCATAAIKCRRTLAKNSVGRERTYDQTPTSIPIPIRHFPKFMHIVQSLSKNFACGGS